MARRAHIRVFSTVANADRVSRRFTAVGQVTPKQKIALFRRVLPPTRRAIAEKTPVDTGSLRRSTRIRTIAPSTVTVGWAGRPNHPDGRRQPYAHWVHEGIRGRRGQPVVRDVIRQDLPRIRREISDGLARLIRRNATKRL